MHDVLGPMATLFSGADYAGGAAAEHGGRVTSYLQTLFSRLRDPGRVAPIAPTNTYYIRPGQGGNGSFSTPAGSLPAVLASNTAYLIYGGSTLTVPGQINVYGLTNVAFGVYTEQTTTGVGTRLHMRVGGAKINFSGATLGFDIYDSSSICVEGIDFTNLAANGLAVKGTQDSTATANWQVLNCRMLAGGKFVEFAIGGTVTTATLAAGTNSFVVQGNVVRNLTSLNAITMYTSALNRIFKGINVSYNTVTNCQTALTIVGEVSTGASTTTMPGAIIACNRFTKNAKYGIWLNLMDVSTTSVYRNTCSKNNLRGISIEGPKKDTTGFIIQGNTCNNNEIGIQLTSMLDGDWLVEGNICWYNGSVSNTAPAMANSSRYGRGIELVGPNGDPTLRCEGGIVRFNSCCFSYDWGGLNVNATEGCGIGTDDQTRACLVAANFCAWNEGNGIQHNGVDGCVFTGNLLVENCNKPNPPRGGSAADFLATEFNFTNDCIGTAFINNTLVCGTKSVDQHGGIGCPDDPVLYSVIANNLIINARVAGIFVGSGGGATISNNAFIKCGAPMRMLYQPSVFPPVGPTDIVKAALPPTMMAPFFTPAPGSDIAVGGGEFDAAAISLSGEPFDADVPIGAVAVRPSLISEAVL